MMSAGLISGMTAGTKMKLPNLGMSKAAGTKGFGKIKAFLKNQKTAFKYGMMGIYLSMEASSYLFSTEAMKEDSTVLTGVSKDTLGFLSSGLTIMNAIAFGLISFGLPIINKLPASGYILIVVALYTFITAMINFQIGFKLRSAEKDNGEKKIKGAEIQAPFAKLISGTVLLMMTFTLTDDIVLGLSPLGKLARAAKKAGG